MRKGIIRAILGGCTVMLLFVPSALAATPEDIYKDLVDNGRLDGTYTQAEMQAFLQSASVQGYGNPVIVAAPPVVTAQSPATEAVTPSVDVAAAPAAVATPPAAVATPPAAAQAAPATGVAGTTKTIVKKPAKASPVARVAGVATPAQQPLARTASAETLPFTGIELALFALVGSALLLGGLLLRASARQR